MTKTMTTQGIAIQWEANYAQSAEKHLVHKAFNSEVFLTDSHRIDESERVAVSHSFDHIESVEKIALFFIRETHHKICRYAAIGQFFANSGDSVQIIFARIMSVHQL